MGRRGHQPELRSVDCLACGGALTGRGGLKVRKVYFHSGVCEEVVLDGLKGLEAYLRDERKSAKAAGGTSGANPDGTFAMPAGGVSGPGEGEDGR